MQAAGPADHLAAKKALAADPSLLQVDKEEGSGLSLSLFQLSQSLFSGTAQAVRCRNHGSTSYGLVT